MVHCFCSNATVYAKQRLSDVEKPKPRDGDSIVDDVDEMSSAVMHTTLGLLLRYQRLLTSWFIADKSQNVTDVRSLTGIANTLLLFHLLILSCTQRNPSNSHFHVYLR